MERCYDSRILPNPLLSRHRGALDRLGRKHNSAETWTFCSRLTTRRKRLWLSYSGYREDAQHMCMKRSRVLPKWESGFTVLEMVIVVGARSVILAIVHLRAATFPWCVSPRRVGVGTVVAYDITVAPRQGMVTITL